jgi:hypothetical protein
MCDANQVLVIFGCIFIGYFTLHLIIEDIMFAIKYCRKINNSGELTVQEQKTVTIIILKLFETVSIAVTGYYDCFKTCWTTSLDCMKFILEKYIDFLQELCKYLLIWPTNIILSTASVIIVGIIPIILYVIEYKI